MTLLKPARKHAKQMTIDIDNTNPPFHELLAAAIDHWLGRSRGGYDFWKIGRLISSVDTARYFEEHMLTTPLYGSKAKFHDAIFRMREIPGLLLEFGVAGGKSINRLAKIHPGETIYGFDSFKGLPEAWRPDYQKSHFAQPIPQVRDNVKLVVGWFNETLPAFLEEHHGVVSLLHIDCDLYSSTKVVLDLLRDRIKPGTVIVFDEYFNYPGWRMHEHKAFMEFVEENRLRFRYIGAVKSNKQVAVRVE